MARAVIIACAVARHLRVMVLFSERFPSTTPLINESRVVGTMVLVILSMSSSVRYERFVAKRMAILSYDGSSGLHYPKVVILNVMVSFTIPFVG